MPNAKKFKVINENNGKTLFETNDALKALRFLAEQEGRKDFKCLKAIKVKPEKMSI